MTAPTSQIASNEGRISASNPVLHLFLLLSSIGAICCTISISQNAAAQFILEEEDESSEPSFDWLRYLEAEVTAIGSTGSGSRLSVYSKIGYSLPLWQERIWIRAAGDYAYRVVRLTQKLNSDGRQRNAEVTTFREQDAARPEAEQQCNGTPPAANCILLPESATFTPTINEFGLDLASVSIAPIDSLQIRGGLDVLRLGQFNTLSVIQFLLPFELQNKSLGLSRDDFSISQWLVEATYYPIEELELSFAFMPQFRYDSLIDQFFLGAITLRPSCDNLFLFIAASNYTTPQGFSRPTSCSDNFRQYEKSKLSGSHWLARGVWRKDSLTLGLTYYNGHSNFSFVDGITYVDHFSLDPNSDGNYSDARWYMVPSFTDQPHFAESNSWGIEVAWIPPAYLAPPGSWTYILEITVSLSDDAHQASGSHYVLGRQQGDDATTSGAQLVDAVDGQCPRGSTAAGSSGQCWEPRTQQYRNQLATFQRWLSPINEGGNAGRSQLSRTTVVGALGMDGASPSGKFNYNVQLLFFGSYWSNAGLARALDSNLAPPRFGAIPVLPSFTFWYDHNLFGKQASAGLSAGFFGYAYGAFAYYNWEPFENFSIQAAFEFLGYQADQANSRSEGGGYYDAPGIAPGVSLGATLYY